MKNTMKKILCTMLVVVLCLSSAPLVGFDFTAEAADYQVGDIIQFGSYPQSEVKDEDLIAELNALSPEWDEWTSYEYYSGTGAYGTMVQGDWMRYIDISYNDSKYRGVKFTRYRPDSTSYTYSTSNSYQDDNGYYTDTNYWFQFEPIDWRVLDPDTGLVMCETIIDSQPYSNTVYYKSSLGTTYGYFNDESYINYASDYETSSIRKWLNDDFYYIAFTEAERSEISTTHLNNNSYHTSIGSTGYEDFDGNKTNDKIFLLSYTEIGNSAYGFSSNYSNNDTTKTAKGSDYAKCNGLWVFKNSGNENYSWLLRSPGYYSNCCCGVYYYGQPVNAIGVNDTNNGVRPAFQFNRLSNIEQEDFVYSALADGTVEITGYLGSKTDLRIPEKIEDKLVSSIGDYAFANCPTIRTITISKTIKNIGRHSFNFCDSLECINVDNNNSYYSSLDGVLYNKNRSILLKYPIAKKNREFTVDEPVIEIADYAFCYYGNKSGATGNKNLTSIIISDSVINIGCYSFAKCESLQSVTMGNNVNYIGEFAFYNCDELMNLKLPNSLLTIEWGAFCDCDGLTTINIPDSVIDIGIYAFGGCKNLKSVSIGTNIKSIGSDAFDKCENLESVYITDLSKWCAIIFDGAYSNPLFYASNLYLNNELLTEIIVPDNVTAVSDYAFFNYDNLYTLKFSNNDTTIGEYTFASCSNLTELALPNNLKTISNNSFQYTNINSINIPDSVTLIGSSAFLGCANLENVTIGKSVDTIYASAFRDCNNIKNVFIKSLENWCQLDLGGNGYAYSGTRYYDNPLYYTTNLYLNNKLVEKLKVPQNLSSVTAYTFSGYKKLKELIIYDTLTSIEEGAFYECDINTIHYVGAKADWDIMTIGKNNDILDNAQLHCDCYIVAKIDSNCTTIGYTEGIYCPSCKKFVDGHTIIDKKTHTYTSEITTPATHLTEGVETFTCECGDSYTKPVAKLEGHTYESVVTAPTCSEKGYTTYSCACGENYNDNYVSAKGHNFDGEICKSCGNKCSHLCHKSGFLGFIWKIVRFFWKLFRINHNCACGIAHY